MAELLVKIAEQELTCLCGQDSLEQPLGQTRRRGHQISSSDPSPSVMFRSAPIECFRARTPAASGL